MRKNFALATLLFGMLTAILLGSASLAQASTGFSCGNSAVNVVTCNNISGNPVTVTITGNRALTGNEITILQNVLNNTTVSHNNIQAAVVEVYKSFNPPINITVQDVNVCIASVCK